MKPTMATIPLAYLLATVRPGSYEGGWGWADEARDLWSRESASMAALVQSIASRGQEVPVMIGDDRSLWDGHHRVVALIALCADSVRVESWADLDEVTANERLTPCYERALRGEG